MGPIVRKDVGLGLGLPPTKRLIAVRCYFGGLDGGTNNLQDKIEHGPLGLAANQMTLNSLLFRLYNNIIIQNTNTNTIS